MNYLPRFAPMAGGFSLRIFLPDGSPDGLRIVEKSNWTGRGVVCPRPLFPSAKSRDEFSRPGVYVLLGPAAEDELPVAYIGQGDALRPRLESHQIRKDFWTTAICFTSKDPNLIGSYVQFLESRLVALALEAKRCTLDNGNIPQLPHLPEADIADTENFLSEMLLCFPVLGVTIFEKVLEPTRSAVDLFFNVAGVSAQGRESTNGFIVLAGSVVRDVEKNSMSPSLKGLKAALIGNGVIAPGPRGLQFTQNYEFSSPSTAATVVQGASANGLTGWKTADGRTLKELQEAAI